MTEEPVDKYEFDRMTREERDQLFWALIQHLKLQPVAIKWDGFPPDYEFRREE